MNEAFYFLRLKNQAAIYGGPADGQPYPFEDACPHCGTGAVKLGSLMYPAKYGPDRQQAFPLKPFLTLDFEIIFPAKFAQPLRSLSPNCFRQVQHSKTGDKLDYYQMVPEAVLPPFDKIASKGAYELSTHRMGTSCAYCHRDGFFGPMPFSGTTFVYRNVADSLLKSDSLASWEGFGCSILKEPFHKSVLAKPLMIVSERFKEVLATYRQFELFPIAIR